MKIIKMNKEKPKFFYLVPTLVWIIRITGKTLAFTFLYWMIVVWDKDKDK